MKRVENLQVRPVGYYEKRRNKDERSDGKGGPRKPYSLNLF